MLKFIHITDCHLSDQSNDNIRNVNTVDSLSNVIKNIKQNEADYDFLLVTGDISQTGSETSYVMFQKLILSLNKPVYCLPGNHDNPGLLKRIFPKAPDKALSVNLVKQHLLILLNTHAAGLVSGEVSENQLQQLENMLLTNRNRPVIVALHHHPISIGSLWMDEIGLTNGNALIALLEKFSAVKLLLFGHVHQALDIKHHHINILGTPSTCFQFKPLTETLLIDELGPCYRVVKLLNNGSIESGVHYL